MDSDALDDLETDPANDVGYLLCLVADALDDDENFDDDYDRALWAVAQWCQELQSVPDLRDYSTGKQVPPGEQSTLFDANFPGYEE